MICVDASVAAKWVLLEDRSDKAVALYRANAQTGQPVVAPPLLLCEVTNILRQRMIRSSLALADADRLLGDFLTIQIDFLLPPGQHQQALALADAHGLPAAYDAHYLALAQRLGCDLWTDDQRLLHAVGGVLAFVCWIGDFTPIAG